MTRRRRVNPDAIQIEALQPNGEWWLRNAFTFENAEVMGGEKSRHWLIALANATMTKWRGFDTDKPLRITGIPVRKVHHYVSDEENGDAR